MKRVSGRGFTLIELLVVIAIIAILAAILFPVFNIAKERGRQARCVSNLRQLTMAFQRYCDDNSGRMPSILSNVNPPDFAGSMYCGAPAIPSKGLLWPYTKNKDIYYCSSDNKLQGFGVIRNLGLSYSANYVLHYQILEPAVAGRSAKVLMLIHEGRKSINDGYFAWGNGFDLPSNIHYDGTTASYCDGHARWLSYNELRRQEGSGEWRLNDDPLRKY